MATAQLPLLTQPSTPAPRLDAITARAVRLGLWPMIEADAATSSLVDLADSDARLLRQARARIERALADEWSQVAARAAQLLRAAEATA